MNHTKTHAGVVGLPFASTTMLAVLGAVVALGGGYGGYRVYKNYQGYGANFDGRPHTLVRVFDGENWDGAQFARPDRDGGRYGEKIF